MMFYDILQVIGVDWLMPENMYELIPWLLSIFIGLFVVSAVFRAVSYIAVELMRFRRL